MSAAYRCHGLAFPADTERFKGLLFLAVSTLWLPPVWDLLMVIRYC